MRTGVVQADVQTSIEKIEKAAAVLVGRVLLVRKAAMVVGHRKGWEGSCDCLDACRATPAAVVELAELVGFVAVAVVGVADAGAGADVVAVVLAAAAAAGFAAEFVDSSGPCNAGPIPGSHSAGSLHPCQQR